MWRVVDLLLIAGSAAAEARVALCGEHLHLVAGQGCRSPFHYSANSESAFAASRAEHYPRLSLLGESQVHFGNVY